MNSMICGVSCRLALLTGVLLTGCGRSEPSPSYPASGTPADHHASGHQHAHPESLAEALTELEDLRAKIESAFAAGDLGQADGLVHEIGHLLDELPKLAVNRSLSESDREQFERALESLMHSFGALDERLHKGPAAGKSYDEVASQIDAALTELKSLVKQEVVP